MRKSNRWVIALGILVMVGVAWYMLITTVRDTSKSYQTALNSARKFAKLKINKDAEEKYFEAYNISPSYELSVEIAKFYKNTGEDQEFLGYTESKLEEYPDSSELYDVLIDYYYSQQMFENCVDSFEQIDKRGISSKIIEKVRGKLEKEYEMGFVSYQDVKKYRNGFCAVMGDSGKWSYVTEKGNNVIDSRYLEATGFSGDGTAVVRDDEDCYIIDDEGNRKFVNTKKQSVEECRALSEGLMAIKVNGKFIFVKDDFSEAFKGNYEDASVFFNGVTFVKNNGKWFLINEKGNRVGESEYDDVILDEIGFSVRQKRAFVKQNGMVIMIDTNGKKIGQDSYEDAKPFNAEGYAAIRKNGKWGFVDINGKVVIEPKYENARSFSNGNAAIMENGKWGFINKKQSQIVECRFDDAKDFSPKKSCFVKENEQWNLIVFYM